MARARRERAALIFGTGPLAVDAAAEIARTGRLSRVATCGSFEPGTAEDHRALDPLARGAARRLAELLAELNPDVLLALGASLSPVTPARVGRHDAAIAAAVAAGLRLWHERGGRLARLVALSATAVYGFARTSPLLFTESDRSTGIDPDPDSAYGNWVRELREMEQLYSETACERGFALCLLRSAPVVGGPAPSFISDYLDAPFPVRVAGYDPAIQVVHYKDLVSAIERSSCESVSGTINIVGSGVTPLSRLTARAGRLAPALPRSLARRVMPRAVDVATLCWRCVADGRRATQLLGFMPTHATEEAIGSRSRMFTNDAR